MQDKELTTQEMIDYLLSTGLYEIISKKHPEKSLYYEIKMMESKKCIPIADLVKRFIEMDKYYNGRPWNIQQILANIDMIVPTSSRENILNDNK